MTHPLASANFVSLTTYRKSGEGVATPVWIAPLDDELVVITLEGSWKVKRLERDARATLRACDVRGRVADGAASYEFTARVSRDRADLERVKGAMNRKYFMARLGNLAQSLLSPVKSFAPRAAVFLAPTTSPVEH